MIYIYTGSHSVTLAILGLTLWIRPASASRVLESRSEPPHPAEEQRIYDKFPVISVTCGGLQRAGEKEMAVSV